MNDQPLHEIFSDYKTLDIGRGCVLSYWKSQRKDIHNELVETWFHGVLLHNGIEIKVFEDDLYCKKDELLHVMGQYAIENIPWT